MKKRMGQMIMVGSSMATGLTAASPMRHKYFWVQAEADRHRLAAATIERAKPAIAGMTICVCGSWSWRHHLVDHMRTAPGSASSSREGAWIEPYKSPAGKVDYHTMGACWDVSVGDACSRQLSGKMK